MTLLAQGNAEISKELQILNKLNIQLDYQKYLCCQPLWE